MPFDPAKQVLVVCDLCFKFPAFQCLGLGRNDLFKVMQGMDL